MFHEMTQMPGPEGSEQRLASVGSRQKYSIGVAAAFIATAILMRQDDPALPGLPIERTLLGGPAGGHTSYVGAQQHPPGHGTVASRASPPNRPLLQLHAFRAHVVARTCQW